MSGTVFLAEGEKDCLNLNRLGYNTASGEDGAGPGKWRKEYTAELAGLSIVIFQDNDDVGKAYAQEIAAALYGAAASVRVLDLSRVWADIPEHGDVSDLITCFGDKKARELITELMQSTPEWAPGIAGSLHENKEESMKKDYIIAPECIRHRLEEAESAAVAITGLMEDVIDPAFDGYACRGLLDAWSKETGGDKGSAAVNWMEKHFDALYAACNAVNALSRQVADILQMLPRVQEKEAVQNG